MIILKKKPCMVKVIRQKVNNGVTSWWSPQYIEDKYYSSFLHNKQHIYTFLNDLHPFILKQLLIIFIPIYLFTVSIILYSKMVSYNQFGILLLYTIFIFMTHLQNINIITKRYMPNDFYLAYLNIYFIFIDIFDIIIFDIFVEMLMPKRKYKSYKKY